jgi:CubicO group peptidase (beta-lactamase class C family)
VAGFQTPKNAANDVQDRLPHLFHDQTYFQRGAMMLVEEGRLKLDDPISSYIPDFTYMTVGIGVDPARPARHRITLRDLLHHTSGKIYCIFDQGPLGALYGEASVRSRNITPGKFTVSMANLPLRAEPGTAWQYGRSTNILGGIIEVAAGQTLDRFGRRASFASWACKTPPFIKTTIKPTALPSWGSHCSTSPTPSPCCQAPTEIIGAGYGPLRDEGIAYA